MKAVIDLNAVKHNLSVIRSHTEAEVYAVVKSNAYGHGFPLATFLQPYVNGFCVATAGEATELIHLAVYKPILILGAVSSSYSIPTYENLIYTVCSIKDLKRLSRVRHNAPFFIKVNTGMNRLGCEMSQLKEMADYSIKNKMNCKGIYTHFFNADNITETNKQYLRLTQSDKHCGRFKCHTLHCCAGNVLKLNKMMHGDIVRAGLPLYGYGAPEHGLKPAMSVSAPIVQIRNVNRSEHVGYGDYITDRDCRVAVVAAGYGDGYRRINKQIRHVSVNGKRCHLIGQVCMDMFTVDISGADAKVGDDVYLLGNGIDAKELAAEYGTIVYEVLTSFGGRMERIYKYE